MNAHKKILNSILLIATATSTGCTTLPQRRVLISNHPQSQKTGITLASFPADLRAYTILRQVDPKFVKELSNQLDDIRKADGEVRERMISDFNRAFDLHITHTLLPEAPARVVVTLKKMNPELSVTTSGSTPGGTIKTVMEQDATDLGAMPESELKSYLAYLGFIQTANNRNLVDKEFNEFLLKLVATPLGNGAAQVKEKQKTTVNVETVEEGGTRK
jgi:hypothetical protein